jgi:4'-phosphopantetheinyl transferase
MPVVFCEIDSPRSCLGECETHVYIAPLTDAGPFLPHLTEDEQARANRFRLARVRDQFVAARGRLRELLGCYLGISPRTVPILYADAGKPHLPPEFALEFNISHTDGMALFAVGTTRVGVDVERDRPIPDADGLVSRFFSRREIAEFQAIPPLRRQAAFLRAWTRKEAVLKAIGRGVQSLDYCEVTFADGEPPAVRSIEGDASAGDRWQLITWEPAAGYLAAVAVEKK